MISYQSQKTTNYIKKKLTRYSQQMRSTNKILLEDKNYIKNQKNSKDLEN